jgi:hypothetical protein
LLEGGQSPSPTVSATGIGNNPKLIPEVLYNFLKHLLKISAAKHAKAKPFFCNTSELSKNKNFQE